MLSSSEFGSFLNAEGHFWDFVLTPFYIVFIWNRQKKPQCFAKYFWKEQALWIIIFMFYLLLGVFRWWKNLLSPEKGFERLTLRYSLEASWLRNILNVRFNQDWVMELELTVAPGMQLFLGGDWDVLLPRLSVPWLWRQTDPNAIGQSGSAPVWYLQLHPVNTSLSKRCDKAWQVRARGFHCSTEGCHPKYSSDISVKTLSWYWWRDFTSFCIRLPPKG